MSFDSTNSVSGINNLSYLNQEDQVKPIVVRARRAPTTFDRRFKIGTLWVDQVSNASWQLTSVSGGEANWLLLGIGEGDLESLTGDTGGAILPDGAGNINIVGNDLYTVDGSGNTLTITETTGAYPITPFVVGVAGQAGYQTIQSAIDAADAAGGGLVFVQPGVFTENLTLASGICMSGSLKADGVTIIGTHTPPTSGSITLRDFTFEAPNAIFSSAAAGTASIKSIDNDMGLTSSGYTYDLLNWTGGISARNENNTSPGPGRDGYINNTGGSSVNLRDSVVGQGIVNDMIITGIFVMAGCNVQCPIQLQQGSNFSISDCFIRHCMTLTGNSTGIFSSSTMRSTNNDVAIIDNSTGNVTVMNCGISTFHNPAIEGTGSGFLRLDGVDFDRNFDVAGTLNVSAAGSRGGEYIATVAGKGISITEGTNARQGVAVLVAGTVTVATTVVTATSRIFLTSQIDGGTPGFLRVSATTVGTDFTITSSNAADTSTVAWVINEPA